MSSTPSHIAVLGGGITGLTAAFHLSRRFPAAQITLIEKSDHFGGWMRSRRHFIGEESMLLEAGPRTLRPQSKALLELINLLNLKEFVIKVPYSAPVAGKKFLYLPERDGLDPVPNSLVELFTTYLGGVILGGALLDLFASDNRPPNCEDESIHSFITRRFGPECANTLGSAWAYGLRGADSNELSARAAFPQLWESHLKGGGSVVRSIPGKMWKKSLADDEAFDLGDVKEFMKDSWVFSFTEGVEELPRRLYERLQAAPNVNVVHSEVKKMTCDENTFQINTTSGVFQPSHVVSTVPILDLAVILNGEKASFTVPHLRENPSASITVVNFIFDRPCEEIHQVMFGYLVPSQTNVGDSKRRPSAVIGTVFDSAILPEQDTSSTFTKVGVMLAGCPCTFDVRADDSKPQDNTIAEFALASLEKHLDQRLPKPVFFEVHYQRECMPIHTVGHIARMEQLRSELESQPWLGRLAVIGAGVDGISIPSCIEAGRKVAARWV